MAHLVSYQAYNVTNAPLPQALGEVSFDGGGTFRELTADERTAGFSVEVDQSFVARLSLPHHFPVQQGLRVRVDDDGELRLIFEGPTAPGSMGTIPIVDVKRGNTKSFVFSAWLSIFRDAAPAMSAAGNAPVAPFMFNILEFDGPAVLSSGGTNVGRFAATVRANVQSNVPSEGTLIFGETPDDSTPQVSAIWVPNGMDLLSPVPVHVFFSPSTGRKTGTYPFSNGANGFNAVLHNFLTGGGKRFINQHVSAKRRCLFVFPLAPPKGYFAGIQDAARLRLYCLEAVHLAQRLVAQRVAPTARLDRCALSAFSEGGRPLNNVVVTSLRGEFKELKELYCLDTVSPAGSDGDAGSYSTFLGNVRRWQALDADRRVRIYTRSAALDSVASSLGIGGPVRRNGLAKEYASANTTLAFTPELFWRQLQKESAPALNPLFDLSDLHQVMPCAFMQHGLKNSGFASL